MKLISLSILLALASANFDSAMTGVVMPVKMHRAHETVKVYPTPYNEGSITISSVNHATLHFYLFDLEGKLVFQTMLKKNDKQVIEGLTRGTYSYNAFQNDESIKDGQVILK
jgi:hypothetical protein